MQIIFVLNVQLLLMTFWFIGRCGEVWCVGEYCCRMAVDDDGELERKSVALRFLLGIEEGGYFKDVYHVEERVTEYSNMMFDPNFEGGEQGNVENIDFNYRVANNLDHGLYF